MAIYFFSIGTGNPNNYSSYSPTFISFQKYDGTTLTPPGITYPGITQGLFQFSYSPSFAISFVIDGGSSISAAGGRYVSGGLSPLDYLDTSLANQGSTLVAIGNTLSTATGNLSGIGSTASAFGDSSTDPGTLFGYVKRIREFLEGNQTYTKGSGAWLIKDRAGLTTIASKTIAQSASLVTRS